MREFTHLILTGTKNPDVIGLSFVQFLNITWGMVPRYLVEAEKVGDMDGQAIQNDHRHSADSWMA